MSVVKYKKAVDKVEKGEVLSGKVEIKIYKNLEHGKINKVTSIVLHRTDSTTAKSTLNVYAGGQKTGAHFLVDKSGCIYQTANTNKICWHVGILLPRCKIEKGCNAKELKTIKALIHEKGVLFGKRAKNLSNHEKKKQYPLRYPTNYDSIGIEVVGRFRSTEKNFEEPTSEQFESVEWLVGILVKEYGLCLKSDVYAHGVIARKQKVEGIQLLDNLLSGIKS